MSERPHVRGYIVWRDPVSGVLQARREDPTAQPDDEHPWYVTELTLRGQAWFVMQGVRLT